MTHLQTPAVDPASAQCPRCDLRGSLSPAPNGRLRCNACQWQGQVYDFIPPPRVVEATHAAMPDDITCAFHPGKKAAHICAGTGSYICPLCTLEINGETYSADFINRGGLKQQQKKNPFERTIPRPDSAVMIMLLLSLFPYCLPLAPIWAGIGLYQFVVHQRMRRENAFYARLTRPWATAIYLTIQLLIAGAIMLSIVWFMVAIIIDL